MKHTTALAALVVAATSLASLPVAAQDTISVVDRGNREIHRTIIRDGGSFGRGPGIIGLVCSPDGAEMLEIALVRLSHRVDLTADQQPLFDALKDKALTTQTSFADDCAAARPDRTADAKPDLLERMKSGLKVEELRLAALNAVLPDFEAFYSSLTDEQKASLMPRGPDDRGAPGRMQRGPAPGR